MVTSGLMCAPVAGAAAETRMDTMTVLPKNIPTGTADRGHVDSVATKRPDIKLSEPEATPSMTLNKTQLIKWWLLRERIG